MKPPKICLLFILLLCSPGLAGHSYGQFLSTESYEIHAAPDLWYNTVDGLLVGVRFRGEDPRTFLDGPHRLNAGLRLATRFPGTSVGYHISYTHPIEAISHTNSEGAIHLFSSVRVGMHHHRAGIQKRWQPGFDELISTELHVHTGFYKRFNEDYLIYDELWQSDPVLYWDALLRKRDRNTLGRWTMKLSGIAGLPLQTDDLFLNYAGRPSDRPEALGLDGLFGQLQVELLQQIQLPGSFYARTRFFGGASTKAVPGEHRYLSSQSKPFQRMDSRSTRARGSIPQSWMESGNIHLPGGPGLRGYTFQTSDQLEAGFMPWLQHALSASLDIYYPNPVDTYFSKIPYLGDLLRLESYLFSDAGVFYNHSDWQKLLMNAGPGFMLSLNIPDYLGQNRGFFIRYELPLWISDVNDEDDHLEIRHLLGIGAQYQF